ncbi:DUF308 domain-containing protein [Candidatus Saccharibacteria bacterium]|nr:DUF308 domain-containing protein [Candidatus Saccharibacteria bacterium]
MENAAAMPTRSSLVWRGLANILLGLVAIGWPDLTLYVLVIVFAINIIAVGAVDLFRPFFEKNTKHAVLTVVLGLLSIMVGFYLLGRPELTVSIMGLVVAFWAMLFGISDLFIGFGDSSNPAGYRILFIFTGVLSILFGFYLLTYPIASLVTLVWIVGVFALLSGITYIIGSFFLPDAKK